MDIYMKSYSVLEGITWVDANILAEQMGGYLATITSQYENDFVFSLINDAQYWNGNGGPLLGGYQLPGSIEPDGGWMWVTGEPFVYSNWRFDQPNNASEIENCIHFGYGGGIIPKWNDLPDVYVGNGNPIAYVVEYENIPEPIQWSVSEGGNGHLYQAVLVPEGISWTEARIQAEQAGGYLATITSQAENDFVSNLIGNEILWTKSSSSNAIGGPWIGGYQAQDSIEPDGGWGWITGEPFDYSAWTAENPDNFTVGGCTNQTNIHYMSQFIPGSTWNDQWDDCPGYVSISYVIEYSAPYCSESIPGDVNGDCVVNFEDMAIMAAHWLECYKVPASDCP